MTPSSHTPRGLVIFRSHTRLSVSRATSAVVASTAFELTAMASISAVIQRCSTPPTTGCVGGWRTVAPGCVSLRLMRRSPRCVGRRRDHVAGPDCGRSVSNCLDGNGADRCGFAYGTLAGHPESGEESFVVAQTATGIRFEVTAVSRPAGMVARIGAPVARAIQRRTSRRYLSALVDDVATSVR
jgi:Domain of unknown function (DUF1990)